MSAQGRKDTYQKGLKMSGIVLSASVRQNLLSLQSTADLLATTQNRLSTLPPEMGPHKIELSQERVTDERAVVGLALPEHATLARKAKGETDDGEVDRDEEGEREPLDRKRCLRGLGS